MKNCPTSGRGHFFFALGLLLAIGTQVPAQTWTINWTKYDNTIPAVLDWTSTNGKIPLGSNGKGDDARSGFQSVIQDGSTYKMWYSGYDGANYRIYHATSSNGLEWSKHDNTIPPASDTTNSNSRLGLGTAGKGDDTLARSPAVILVGDRNYKMWYSGSENDGGTYQIYHATGLGSPTPGTVFTIR